MGSIEVSRQVAAVASLGTATSIAGRLAAPAVSMEIRIQVAGIDQPRIVRRRSRIHNELNFRRLAGGESERDLIFPGRQLFDLNG